MSAPELRKAAVLLLSLPEEQAVQLLSKLQPRQVEAVTIEIAKSNSITADEQQSVIRDFADADLQSIDADLQSIDSGQGGIDVAKALVERALGKGNPSLDRIRQSIAAPLFGFLQHVDAQDLLAVLAGEHPQTIALVLSHLPPSYAAEIISGLPDEHQSAVLRRIAAMGETNPEMVQEVERGLERRIVRVVSRQFERAGSVATVVEILNGTDRATERRVLENLADDGPEMAAEIRRLSGVSLPKKPKNLSADAA